MYHYMFDTTLEDIQANTCEDGNINVRWLRERLLAPTTVVCQTTAQGDLECALPYTAQLGCIRVELSLLPSATTTSHLHSDRDAYPFSPDELASGRVAETTVLPTIGWSNMYNCHSAMDTLRSFFDAQFTWRYAGDDTDGAIATLSLTKIVLSDTLSGCSYANTVMSWESMQHCHEQLTGEQFPNTAQQQAASPGFALINALPSSLIHKLSDARYRLATHSNITLELLGCLLCYDKFQRAVTWAAAANSPTPPYRDPYTSVEAEDVVLHLDPHRYAYLIGRSDLAQMFVAFQNILWSVCSDTVSAFVHDGNRIKITGVRLSDKLLADIHRVGIHAERKASLPTT